MDVNMKTRIQEWATNHHRRYRAMVDHLDLRCGEIALDVGIELYTFTELLFEQPVEVSVAGTEYGDDSAERTAHVGGEPIPVRECNVETDRWPYPDGEFDRVVMGAIIEHLFDLLAAFEEARRVLADGGRFVLSTPNAIRLIVCVNTLIGINPYDDYPMDSRYNRHNHEWTLEELRDVLAVVGFDPVEIETVIHPRSGPQQFVEWLSHLSTTFHDQFIVAARKTEPEDRLPSVYREGITKTTHE